MKRIRKSLVFLLSIMLVLGSFTMFASAAPKHELLQSDIQQAEIFGDINLSSSELITVIVELKEESIVEAKHKGKSQSKGNLKNKRNDVISEMKSKVSHTKVNREYDYLFSGFSVELPANEISILAGVPGVKAIYPNVLYTVDQMGEGVIIDAEAYSPLMLDSAPFIGADLAWAAGYTGKGITVAVIDTGADYTHPDLKHAFGDYKGYDFVDNDDDPIETLPGDPNGAATDHGSHVSGTVAANGLIKGVAPEAKLLAYRVLGPGGSGTTENVVAGIERAVQDGAHIMNLSLGNTLNNADWATSIALDWAMAEGVVAVTSNGNSGPNNWTVGSPGTSREAISVGATQLPYNNYSSRIFTSENVEYTSPEVMGFPNDAALLALNEGEFEFVFVGLGYPKDFEGKDLTGKIALIKRGEIPFVDKSDNAKAAGAIGTIIFNAADPQIEHFVAGISLPTIKISGKDGEKILAELARGINKVSFEINFANRVDETVADFSSRGPVIDTWMIKPDVSAPGVAIVSTIRDGQYGSKQGTSMASPHVAGAAALILQANPKWSVDEVKAALMNTAENLSDPSGKVYPHNTQGAGSIRVLDAINTEFLVTPGSHSFGVFYDDENIETRKQTFTIKNLTKENKEYTISFEGEVDGISVRLDERSKKGKSPIHNVSFSVDVDTSKLAKGFYEGMFVVNDGEQIIEVPTILFVQEPNYPRITHLFIEQENDEYLLTVYLPRGAELLEFWVYRNTPWGYVGDALVEYDVPSGYSTFTWDGTINGEHLAPGLYQMIPYALKAGKGDYLYTTNSAFTIAAQPLTPIVEDVVKNEDGTFTAFWSYNNENKAAVKGISSFEGEIVENDITEEFLFLPGLQENAFTTTFTGESIVWTLTGPDGVARSVTALAPADEEEPTNPGKGKDKDKEDKDKEDKDKENDNKPVTPPGQDKDKDEKENNKPIVPPGQDKDKDHKPVTPPGQEKK